jgi:circadian clock protein KaiC
MTKGVVPEGRTTLVGGGAGSGKTIFALHFLVYGARALKEAGIFVAFEESPARIVDNLQGFGWNIAELVPKKLFFMDVQPTPDLIQSGDFDLGGMLAALEAQVKLLGARRIVFDALDVLLGLLPDAAARRRELYRLNAWVLSREMTCIITGKAASDDIASLGLQPHGFMQFMVDCAVTLNHRVIQGVSQRSVRVQKYRGSSFDENESPFVIGPAGFDVALARTLGQRDNQVSNDRVTSGVKRLDTMLGGGYYRASSILITGAPGTAKTTLCGTFAEAACQRGERTLFVSFDSDGSEVMRNLKSVGLRLDRQSRGGMLRLISARTILGSAETLMVKIRALAVEHCARCLVIDPVSTLSKAGNELTAHGVAERLIDWCKSDGITLLCTSLLDEMSSEMNDSTPLQISTLADTWIHLSYVMQAGERNRGLSILKSRGTAHSNQLRELILSESGVTLADIYWAGGEVLMGSMRWEKENSLRSREKITEVETQVKQLRLDAEEAELHVRLQSLQTELQAKRIERKLLLRATANLKGQKKLVNSRLRQMRGADAAAAKTE